jgi:glutathionyl-hydroquinone reductase
MCNRVYSEINNGVYKTGFSASQEAYERNLIHLFQALDRIEAHLAMPEHQPYLFGKQITEADIKLFPSIIRFDVVYHNLFKCNMKMIRLDYPRVCYFIAQLNLYILILYRYMNG